MLSVRPKVTVIDLITNLPSGGYLVLPSALLDTLHKYRQLKKNTPESGGILIGCWRSVIVDGGQVGSVSLELTECTEPSMWDIRHRFGFVRRSRHHIEKALSAWRSSQKKLTYVGEWHTHPEPHPTPSAEDLRQWRKNLAGQDCILIIIGMNSDWVAWWNGSQAIPLPELFSDSCANSN